MPSLASDWWEMLITAFGRGIGLTAGTVLLLLLVTNQLGEGFGAFHVMWSGGRWVAAVSGFAVTLFLWTMAYLTYLLCADRLPAVVERRDRLVVVWVIPLVVVSLLPAVPCLKIGVPSEVAGASGPIKELFMERGYYAIGMFAGTLLFVGLLLLIRRIIHRAPAVGNEAQARQQAWAVLVTILAIYGLGAGYTADRPGALGVGVVATGVVLGGLVAIPTRLTRRPAWSVLATRSAAGLLVALVGAAYVTAAVSHWCGVTLSDAAILTGFSFLVEFLFHPLRLIALPLHRKLSVLHAIALSLGSAVMLGVIGLVVVLLDGPWKGATLVVLGVVATGVATRKVSGSYQLEPPTGGADEDEVKRWVRALDRWRTRWVKLLTVRAWGTALFGLAAGTAVGMITGVVLSRAGGLFLPLPTTVSVCALLCLVGVLYVMLQLYAGQLFYPAGLAVGLLALLIGTIRPHPHRIEELGPYYGLPNRDDEWADLQRAELGMPGYNRFVPGLRPDGKPQRVYKPALANYASYRERYAEAARALRDHPAADPSRRRLQLSDDAVLDEWSRLVAKSWWSPRPPLVVVTASGGASVSAIYTFKILIELEKKWPGFHRHVRLMTGASGGMFGAAYYRALINEVRTLNEELAAGRLDRPTFERKLDELRAPLREDFLSPMLQALSFKDAPAAVLCPVGYGDDRGRQLERAWAARLGGRLNVTFDELRQQERTGLYPSMVFSPMMVEDGRPLLISALDLDRVAVPVLDQATPTLRGLRAVVGSAAVPLPAEDPTLPRGVEFFKLFPEHGWNLRLATAARLSAGFPFLSPAASLPTVPARRLVDAGYYDNHGMTVALGWVADLHRREKLASVCSSVIILQIRPYATLSDALPLTAAEESGLQQWVFESAEERKQLEDWVRKSKLAAVTIPPKPVKMDPTFWTKPVARFWSPLHELTSPVEGGDAARQAGMNTHTSDILSTLQHAGVPVRSVTLAGRLEASLNWFLPPDQIADVERAVDEAFRPNLEVEGRRGDRAAANRAALRRLEGYLQGYFP